MPLHSIPGHPRDSSICAPVSGWIRLWRWWQSQESVRGISGGRGGDDREGYGWCGSEAAGLSWQRSWRVKVVSRGSAWPFVLQLEGPVALSEETSLTAGGKKREIGRQGELKINVFCCLPLEVRRPSMDLRDPPT